MGLFKKLSLRAQVTLLSSAITVTAVLLFTLMSMYSADKIFVSKARDISIASSDDKVENVTIAKEIETATKQEFYSSEPFQQNVVVTEMVPIDFIVTANYQFRTVNYGFMAILIIIGAFMTYIITGRTLCVVGQLSAQMHKINENNLFLRIEGENLSPEIKSMTDSFNHMMDRLENAFAAQKKFAAAAAHELKTPLSCISTNIEVLQLEDKPMLEEYEKTIDVIKRNTDRLIALTEELLDLNRIYEETTSFSVAELCQEIGEELRYFLETKKIMLEIIGDAIMHGSYQAVYQIFFNLVENAVKYNCENGTVNVEIINEGEMIAVSVKDTGIGISKEDLIYIFEPFYRVDKSRNRSMGGAGLGLSIVKELVEKCGGKIYVDSQKGKGSCFQVIFITKTEQISN